jgi:hypothetical protein
MQSEYGVHTTDGEFHVVAVVVRTVVEGGGFHPGNTSEFATSRASGPMFAGPAGP